LPRGHPKTAARSFAQRTEGNVKLIHALVVASCSLVACKKKQPPAPPPPELEVVDVVRRDTPLTYEFVGTMQGEVDAEVRAQVAGIITEQNYREGSNVKKGDLLFVIDPKPFEAAVKEAQGDLAKSQALLAQASADVTRYLPLAQKGAVSKQELEHAQAEEKAARATVVAKSAALDNAKINLGYTHVRAPIAGIAGLAQVKIGNYVGKSEPTLLTTVSQVDPIRVTFAVPEQAYLRNADVFARLERGSTPGENVQLVLADGRTYDKTGLIKFADRQVDRATGTIRLQAQFPNPTELLRPGAFGKLVLHRNVAGGVVLVPQRSVMEQQGVRQVAKVTPDSKIELVNVETGPRIGQFFVVEQGVKEGDRIVYQAMQQAKSGLVITPKPVQPDFSSLTAPAASGSVGGGPAPSSSGN
jgi:membrane fusion protein (multidrug efflux system)